MNLKALLERLNRGEKLDSPTLERLDQIGLINARDVSHMGTPIGQKDYLFIDFTEKGRRVLVSTEKARQYFVKLGQERGVTNQEELAQESDAFFAQLYSPFPGPGELSEKEAKQQVEEYWNKRYPD